MMFLILALVMCVEENMFSRRICHPVRFLKSNGK